MKLVISASRRTDLVAGFPEWLAAALRDRRALVFRPAGGLRRVDLDPDNVHTLVLWSKDFTNLTANRGGLRDLVRGYDQVYFQFTITGLGGTALESGVPSPRRALRQLAPLVDIAGHPGRVSLRFDPLIAWREGGREMTNLRAFAGLADKAAALGLRDIRFSWAQWYAKARRRAARRGLDVLDPPDEDKLRAAAELAGLARERGLRLFSCSQAFLAAVPGVEPSSCIDGRLLQALHPRGEAAAVAKDRSQRRDCGCTASVDIGSYTQACPHGCVYCYANPRA